MKQLQTFIGFWVINSVILYIASLVWTTSIVLGNATLAPIVAAILNGFILTVFVSLVMPTAKAIGMKAENEWEWAAIYFAVNTVIIWVLAKIANVSGIGIAAFWVAIILGFVVNLFQYLLWKVVQPKEAKK